MRILLTVTNDLTYDQRMQRIATTLSQAGYDVALVGRERPQSAPLEDRLFGQYRLHCLFNTGFAFYAEYNLRLLAHLMRTPFDAVGVVDLDTLPAGTLASLWRRKVRVFDAHEYFTEVPEVVHRPVVKAFWELVAKSFLPFFKHAYTVGTSLAELFTQQYGIPFAVVRNVPEAKPLPEKPLKADPPVLLYQGALNEGRGIEVLLQAMTMLEGFELWLVGEGDLSDALRRMANELGVGDRVRFLGWVKPSELSALTETAWLGLNLLENRGLSYYYSLANKYFDCVQACVPVLTMDFPEYRALQQQHPVAVLLSDLHADAVVQAVLHLKENPEAYNALVAAAQNARLEWIWEKEEAVLLAVWANAFKQDRAIG
ncbi:MAG: glycosyltransferase family 4 protein [Saprospiraceae bacterium]